MATRRTSRDSRRTRGDGSLFQRSDGIWIGRVELPPDRDGKRRQRTVSSKSFDVAAKRLKKLRTDVDEGRIAATGNTTVAKWLDVWLTEIHTQQQRPLRPTTVRDYKSTIRLHIKPHIGTKKLDKLTPQNIREMHAKIGPRRAAEKAYIVLHKALDDAIKQQMITFNPAEAVYKPVYQKGKRKGLEVEVAEHIIQTAYASRDESEATRWAAAFVTGARQAELLGLTWDRVDLINGVMAISWQMQQLSKVHGCGESTIDPVTQKEVWPCGRKRPGWCPDSHFEFDPRFEYVPCHLSLLWTRPKTAAGDRYVPIVMPLLIKLREMHANQGVNPHNLVWHYPDGRPIGPREDYESWRSLLIDAGVIAPVKETLPMHAARHTTASLLRKAGVDEQTRMEILGHATVDAQRIYAHADQVRHAAAMSSLGNLIAIESNH